MDKHMPDVGHFTQENGSEITCACTNVSNASSMQMMENSKMKKLRFTAFYFTLATITAMFIGLFGGVANAASTADELHREGHEALQTLYKSNPVALEISKKAKAVLVFPKIIKAGLVFGGAYGEGVLMKGGSPAGYYNSVSASWGFQAGAQSYGYAVFLMNDNALAYLDKSEGWELGVGPTIVVVNEGAAKNISTSTLKDDAYALVFDQQGLMASLSIEGTKVTRIKR